jgi:hypothetical protein
MPADVLYVSVTVNVAVVPEPPMISAAAPVAVYEMLLHDRTSDVVAVVILLPGVQVGLWAGTVIVPLAPNAQPLYTSVSPPSVPPVLVMVAAIGHEFVLNGVDDDKTRWNDVGLLPLTTIDVPVHPILLVHDVNVKPASDISLVPSVDTHVRRIVHVHSWLAPIESDARVALADVPSLLADRSHVVPTTHVNAADADVAPAAITANRTTTTNRLLFARLFMRQPFRWIHHYK